MPRSKTRARLRAARLREDRAFLDPNDPLNDDSGRTPARVDYLFREIGRKLRIMQAARDARTAERLAKTQADPRS